MLTYDHIDSNKRKTAILIAAFLILIIALGFAFSRAYDSPEIVIIAIIFSTTMSLVSYFASDKITLSMSRAKQVDRGQAPELYRLVENLSIAAGLPTPKIYVIDDPAPNAFATGRSPEKASVAFTTGILQKLEKKELEGVVAHELSHIGNYDIRLMTIVVVLVGILTLLADWFLRFSFFGGRKKSSSNGGGQAQAVFMIIGLVLAILSPLIAMIIKLAISRKREFLADASGALLTRYPEGLASALEKISADHTPLRRANKATAHLYISSPLKDHKKDSVSWLSKLFNTHPPAQERITRLRGMHNSA